LLPISLNPYWVVGHLELESCAPHAAMLQLSETQAQHSSEKM